MYANQRPSGENSAWLSLNRVVRSGTGWRSPRQRKHPDVATRLGVELGERQRGTIRRPGLHVDSAVERVISRSTDPPSTAFTIMSVRFPCIGRERDALAIR